MTRVRKWASPVIAVVALAVVIVRLGTGPFLAGVKAVDARAVLEVAVVVLVTTVCSAWRWTIVARGLGLRVPLPAAVAAYYQSLFLNLTLPGGVAGDIHRGVRHGREVRDVGCALRAVFWERAAGQVVQVILTVAALLVLPSPVRSSMPFVAAALVGLGVVIVLACKVKETFWNAVASDIRDGVMRRNAFPAIMLTSVVIVAGHTVTFLIAARTAAATAPISRLLPLALLALLAMVLPNIGGWGPREGLTAWAFAAAGLGAGLGAAAAVAFGVMVLVASLPGAVVLVVRWVAHRPTGAVFRPEGAADA